MKKTIMTIAIVLTMGLSAFAQSSLLGRDDYYDENFRDGETVTPDLPGGFGYSGDQPGTTPIGSGIAVLTALGAAYLVGKRRREE